MFKMALELILRDISSTAEVTARICICLDGSLDYLAFSI